MLQFFLNMEIERYALATGETAITGMNRLGRHWGLVMLLMALASLGWPGWAASSATLVTYLVGGDPQLIGVLMLVASVLMLTVSPVVFRTLERTLAVKVIAVFILFVGAIPFVVSAETAVEAARSAASAGTASRAPCRTSPAPSRPPPSSSTSPAPWPWGCCSCGC